MLVDGDVGEVHFQVVQLCDLRRVLRVAEPRKPLVAEVRLQRAVRSHTHVQPQVKLPPTDLTGVARTPYYQYAFSTRLQYTLLRHNSILSVRLVARVRPQGAVRRHAHEQPQMEHPATDLTVVARTLYYRQV